MTDYASPATPGDALRGFADDLKYAGENLRREVVLLTAKAELIDKLRRDAELAADKYDEWQPKPGKASLTAEQAAAMDGPITTVVLGEIDLGIVRKP